MQLHPPKKTAGGYLLKCEPPVAFPFIRWNEQRKWVATAEWERQGDWVRQEIIGKMVESPKWFTRPPRQEVLEPLFSSWTVRKTGGALEFYCGCPEVPGADGQLGGAVWCLMGVMMTSSAITPIWELRETKIDEAADAISIFGGSDGADEDESREIQLDEIAEALPVGEPTRIRNREWERRKFIAKEIVREARLKAAIALRTARKEESRFYTQFGDLEDGESHFSDYDLTDYEEESSEDEEN